MSDDELSGVRGRTPEAWRGYFAAAITGILAGSQLDPRTTGLPEMIVEMAAKVADAAVEQDAMRGI
jgi:hypothetical protein